MPSLSQTVITGVIYDVNGDPVDAGFPVYIQKTVKSGQVIQWVPERSLTTSGGAISLTAPRSSTIYVYAKAIGLMESGITGVALSVPAAATANLEDLISVSSVPSTGITIKDEGTSFASLVGTINFVGTGVAAVETSAGLATVTISAGSGVPGGSTTQLQYNNAGAFGGITGATTNGTTLAIAGGTATALTGLAIRSTGAAFDLTFASSEVLSAGKTLSFVLGDTSRTLTIGASASVSGSNTGDQTSVSGNAGTATALATARAIYGNNFDGTADLTQVIASTFGGTGNGFAKLSGPASTEKTFTLPNASAAILTDNAAVTVPQGGTGVATLAANGVLYGNGSGAVLVTAQGAANSLLSANAGAPSFSQSPILNTSLQLGVVSSATGSLKLAHASSANLTTIQAGNAAAARTYTWPTNFGAAGTVLTDAAGDGVLSWAAGGGGTAPFDDGTAIIKGSADATKLLRIEVDGFTTGTTRVATFPNADITVARIDAAQTFTGVQSFASPPSSLGSGSDDEVWGSGATGLGSGGGASVALGNSAHCYFQSVAVGKSASAAFGGAVFDGTAIGYAAHVTGNNGTSLGSQATATTGSVAIGSLANATSNSIALGFRVTTGSSNIFVVGSNTTYGAQITDAYFGSGVGDATPVAVAIHGTGGSGSNIIGADVTVAGGTSTGTGAGGNLLLKTSPSGASGSSGNGLITRYAVKAKAVALTSAAAASVAEVTLPTLTLGGGTIDYTIICTDGTDMQSLSGQVVYSAVNKGGAYTTSIKTPEGATADDTKAAKSVSAGTLTLAWSILNGTNKVTIQATPTTSLTPTKFLMYYTITNNSEQALTPD